LTFKAEKRTERLKVHATPKVTTWRAMMAASMTEREFSRHLNTKLRVKIQASSPVELELVEVIGYPGNRGDQDGLERFSVYFIGVGETTLPQSTCTLQHERMGEFDIFIVPIAGNERGFRYEAVFNYFK